jgi:hypothetical protein
MTGAIAATKEFVPGDEVMTGAIGAKTVGAAIRLVWSRE